MPRHRIARASVFYCNIVPAAALVHGSKATSAGDGVRAARSRLPSQTSRRFDTRLTSGMAIRQNEHRAESKEKVGAMPPVEPWLRGGEGDVPAVPRAVLHALQQAEEDLHRWCANLSDSELNQRPE